MEVKEQEITAIVLNLDAIYRKIEDKALFLRMTGDALSYLAVKVATSKARMVDIKRIAEIEAKDADTEYKRIKAETMRKLVGTPINRSSDGGEGPKISATAAGELLYGEEAVVKAAQDKNQKEATYNRLKSLVADGHDVVDSLRSRLIDLQGSRKDERIG